MTVITIKYAVMEVRTQTPCLHVVWETIVMIVERWYYNHHSRPLHHPCHTSLWCLQKTEMKTEKTGVGTSVEKKN